jgi:hypothetical protein
MDGFPENKSDIVPIEMIVVATDRNNASGNIIMPVGPDIAFWQSGTCAVYRLDPIPCIVRKSPTHHFDQCG